MHTIDHTDSRTEPLQADSTGAEPGFRRGSPRREPIWRVVGGSVAAGFLGAIALTLGVFGGSAEHVISGSAVLAFGSVAAIVDVVQSGPHRRPGDSQVKLREGVV